MKDTLRIKQIADYGKSKKDGNIHMRRVEISDDEGKLKVIFNNDFGDLPSVIRRLDRDDDLDTEVVIDIEIQVASRQGRITDSFKNTVKEVLKKDGIDVLDIEEVLEDE